MDLSSLSCLGEYTKTSNPNELLFNCPAGCGKHLYVNLQKGVFFCVICGWDTSHKTGYRGKGSLNSLLSYMGNSTPYVPLVKNASEEEYSSTISQKLLFTELFKNHRLTQKHIDYLSVRGFSNNELKCCSTEYAVKFLKSYSSEFLKPFKISVHNYTNTWLKPDRILIPYYKENIVIGIRSRTLDSTEKVKYLWSTGSSAKNAIYNIDLIPKNKILILTEGEFKAALPTLHGFPTIGIPGISTGHEYLALYLSKHNVEKVYICFDSDPLEKVASLNVKKSIESLSKKLNLFGIKIEITILDLNPTCKVDLDSFILNKGSGVLNSLFPEIKQKLNEVKL